MTPTIPIPFFMCLKCKHIYQADELSAHPEHWNLQKISMFRCPNCHSSKKWIPICPLETYQPEINESRCIIPLIIPEEMRSGQRTGSWFCIFHGKYNECPILSKFNIITM